MQPTNTSTPTPPPGQPPTDPNLAPATGEHRGYAAGRQADVAQLDRKLGTRSYAGAAGLILALAAGIVAIVLAIDARDNSATSADFEELTRQVAGVEELASEGQGIADSLTALTERVDSLESQLTTVTEADTTLGDQLTVVEDDIEDLRRQLSDVETAAADAAEAAAAAEESAAAE